MIKEKLLPLLQEVTESSKLGKTNTNRQTTNLCVKLVLWTGKEQEDSAILLASNRPQHKDKMKSRPTVIKMQNFEGKDSREQTKNK
jgi:hypothetical protein